MTYYHATEKANDSKTPNQIMKTTNDKTNIIFDRMSNMHAPRTPERRIELVEMMAPAGAEKNHLILKQKKAERKVQAAPAHPCARGTCTSLYIGVKHAELVVSTVEP
jgi:hypothetical protein